MLPLYFMQKKLIDFTHSRKNSPTILYFYAQASEIT